MGKNDRVIRHNKKYNKKRRRLMFHKHGVNPSVTLQVTSQGSIELEDLNVFYYYITHWFKLLLKKTSAVAKKWSIFLSCCNFAKLHFIKQKLIFFPACDTSFDAY
jgi:hypothetical protein